MSDYIKLKRQQIKNELAELEQIEKNIRDRELTENDGMSENDFYDLPLEEVREDSKKVQSLKKWAKDYGFEVESNNRTSVIIEGKVITKCMQIWCMARDRNHKQRFGISRQEWLNNRLTKR
jgi:hypothetical protein